MWKFVWKWTISSKLWCLNLIYAQTVLWLVLTGKHSAMPVNTKSAFWCQSSHVTYPGTQVTYSGDRQQTCQQKAYQEKGENVAKNVWCYVMPFFFSLSLSLSLQCGELGYWNIKVDRTSGSILFWITELWKPMMIRNSLTPSSLHLVVVWKPFRHWDFEELLGLGSL